MPHMSSVPMSWRLAKHRYGLVGTACKCGAVHFPPRRVCECGSSELQQHSFSGNGTIESFTVIHVGPTGFEKQTPYNVALIRLDEGPVISGVVVGGANGLEIGKRVKSVFRRLHADGEAGLINYGTKFCLVE